MVTAVYSAIYGAIDSIRPQPVPLRMFTEEIHPLPQWADPRLAAKFWKVRPDIACPDADVTIWLDGSFDILRPDFIDLCVRALGDADIALVRHPIRDDIYEEAAVSVHQTKYDGQPLLEQANHYRREGHPEHWGLMHAGMLVRRNNDRIRLLNEAWWQEITRWSLQDQLSLPPLLRTMDVRTRWFVHSPLAPPWGETGWVRWNPHQDAWKEVA